MADPSVRRADTERRGHRPGDHRGDRGQAAAAGTWLREEALGRVYAVSRTKIRAALLLLSKDKLIQTVPDKGAFVSRPTVEEAREVFAVRRLLEAEVVRLFVARAGKVRLRRAAAPCEGRARDAPRRKHGSLQERLLGDFHVVLAEARPATRCWPTWCASWSGAVR